MPRPSIDWLITDTHWFHKSEKFVEGTGRPENCDELIMSGLKRVLAPQDRLFHLGDCIFYYHQRLKEMLDSINGTKILIMGNHDKKSPGWYSRNGFNFVADMIVVGDILLSHHPIEILPTGVRLNIHGHMHTTKVRPDWWSSDKHRLLAIEYTKYQPVRLIDFSR